MTQRLRGLAILVSAVGWLSPAWAGPGPCQIICPANITVTTPAGRCQTEVAYAAPTTMGCLGLVEQVQGLASGDVFPLGTTTNTFCVAGTAPCCSATVTVRSEGPCPYPAGAPAMSPWLLTLLATALGGLGIGVLRRAS